MTVSWRRSASVARARLVSGAATGVSRRRRSTEDLALERRDLLHLDELLDQLLEGVVVEPELAREAAQRDAAIALQERLGLLDGPGKVTGHTADVALLVHRACSGDDSRVFLPRELTEGAFLMPAYPLASRCNRSYATAGVRPRRAPAPGPAVESASGG